MGQPVFGSVQELKGITHKDAAPLIELIENSIALNTWKRRKGVGTIEFFPPTLSLIVSNTKEVHARVEDLIEKIRELRKVSIEVRSSIVVLPEKELALTGLPKEFLHIGVREAQNIQAMASKKSWERIEIPSFSLLNGQSHSIGWKDSEALEKSYLSLQTTLHPDFAKNSQVRSTINVHNIDQRHLEAQLTCNSKKVTVVDMSGYVLPEDTDQVALFLFRPLITDERTKK